METKKLYTAYTNSDLENGQGNEIPMAICVLESAAIRMGKSRYVRGKNCPVREVELLEVDGNWYVPLDAVPVEPVNEYDLREEQKCQLMRKLKSLGLTDEELNILMN